MFKKFFSKRLSFYKTGIVALTVMCLSILPYPLSFSAEKKKPSEVSLEIDDSTARTEEFYLLKGDLKTLQVSNLKRISIVDPSVADISNAESNEVLLIGNEPGQTIMFVWDDTGKRNVIIRVFSDDLTAVRYRLEKLLENANIKGIKIEENPYEGKLVLTGELSGERKDQLASLMEPFSGSILDLIKAESVDDLVQIDMQITEVNRSLAQTLGFDWDNVNDGDGLLYGFTEGPIEDKGNFNDLFRIGKLSRTVGTLKTIIDMLILEGKAKVLSKPRMIVRSGRQATFLVGGEVPIRTSTFSGSGNNIIEQVSFRSYGVSMSITPTIRNKKVDIELGVEVSDIDEAINRQGSFITRSAQTTLYLDNKQTIVLAGLIRKREAENVKRVRLLGSIPIVGALFRSKDVPKTDVELVISLTPTILPTTKDDDAQQVKMSENATGSSDVSSSLESTSMDESTNRRRKQGGPLISKNLISSNGAFVPEEMSPYIRSIQEKISSAVSYPFEAQENGWEGIVKLSLKILKDGTLGTAAVKESSGYEIFDKDALHTAQTVAPYSPFPPEMDMEELIITIPIIYSHNSFFQNASNSQ